MLIKVMFYFSIQLEDKSSVEVNVKTCLKKTKEMKIIMIDLIKNENEIKMMIEFRQKRTK